MSRSLIRFLVDGLMYPKRFLEGRMTDSTQTIKSLDPGRGGVIDLNGKKTAIYKDPAGKIILHSAVCTHLKCIVKWNETDKTFDCPCHGSRYSGDGTLINGPAPRGLDPAS